MTRYLVSDENPTGHKLEDVLHAIRVDIMARCQKIVGDASPQAREVLANNMRILNHLTDSIELAESSSRLLNAAFGPSKSSDGGPPRIGEL